MSITMRKVDRRSFLKGALKTSGVAMSLPLLETLSWGDVRQAPARMVNVCATLGLYADSWFPKSEGEGYEAGEYLSLIDQHRQHYTLISGLAHANQSGRQAHNSEITWLTSAEHPGLDGFRNTISLDQAAADHLGYVTRFPSIVLGTTSPQSQSYTESGVMVPAETSPAALFTRLFLQGNAEEVAKETRRLVDGGSILDHLSAGREQLLNQVSSADRQKLAAYFEAVRTAERELTEVRAWLDRPKPNVDAEPPEDIKDNADIVGRVRLMLNMVPLILETDSSRVVSLMIQDHGVVPKVAGVSGEHHGLSHHGQDEAKIVQLRKVESALVVEFGSLLTNLRERGLLPSTTVLFGSNLGNANSHSATHLPILVAGGAFRHGGHVMAGRGENGAQDAPLSNLFVTLLRTMGIESDSFGHSDGALTWA